MKRITISFVTLPLLLLILMPACKKDDCGDCIEENLKPRANAGSDQNILIQMDCILDGKLSYDRNAPIANYKWSLKSGPSGATIDNTNAAHTFARFSATGIYEFELQVTNRSGLTATDIIQVKVDTIDGESICNRPIINAKLVPIGRLPGPRSHMKTAAAGNKIIFAGGGTNATKGNVDIYDIVTNSWTTVALSDEALRYDFAMTSLGNKVFFAGGWDNWNGIHTSAVDIYDATSNSWSKANLGEARMGIAAAAAGNTVVFAGGGVYDDMWDFRVYDGVDIYNNATNTWTKSKLSGEGRIFMTATASGNDFYFSGGTLPLYGPSNKIDIYNSNTNSWSVSTLKIPRTRMDGIIDQGKLFLSGGFRLDGNIDGGKYIEIIDVATRISTLDCMIPRHGQTAIKSGDKLIFFTGNAGLNDLRSGSVFEIYDTKTKEWSVGILNRAIQNAGIISVNNTIYVAGGNDAAGKPTDLFWKLEF
jgi:hypothetical protein